MIRALIAKALLSSARLQIILAARLTEPKLPPYREPEPVKRAYGRQRYSADHDRICTGYWAGELA
jgi:hypothetical protein